MTSTTKCLSKWAAAAVAVGFAVMAPVSRAGDPPSPAAAAPEAQPASAPAAPADTQQRLKDLEKQVELLQQAIAALKDSNTPHMQTAAYTLPSAAPAAAAPAAPQDKMSLGNLLGSTTFSGFVDTYYGFNANHPIDNTSGWRFFDGKTNAFSLNMVELIVDHAPDATNNESRFGFHVAAGYGQAANVVNNSDIASDGSNFYVKEAYGSYLAPIGKGLKIDVGRFVTAMGNEVIETGSNWNYSRSLLFYYAIPYFHFGARATYTFNKQFTATGLLVNGWNNSFIQHGVPGAGPFGQPLIGQSSGPTYHGQLAWTPTPKWSVTTMWMAGPVVGAYNFSSDFSGNTVAIHDWRQLSDTIISFTPNSKWAFALDGNYGFGPRVYEFCGSEAVASSRPRPQSVTPIPLCQSPAVKWWGTAGYAKYNFTPKTYLATRYEYYGDPDGYTGLLFNPIEEFSSSGHGQEFTATYAHNLTSGLQVRGEYRYDFASVPTFLKGSDTLVKEQNTVTLGIIYSFASPAKE